MSLCLSNTTTQNMVVKYRDPVSDNEKKFPLSIDIASGSQVEIGHGWNSQHVANVIRQIEKTWGARDAAEVHTKLKNFHGLLYREKLPVDEEEIKLGHRAVVDMAEERSVKQATRSALAFDRAVNPQKGRRRAKSTQVELEEMPAPGSHPTGDEAHMVIGIDSEEGQSGVNLPL